MAHGLIKFGRKAEQKYTTVYVRFCWLVLNICYLPGYLFQSPWVKLDHREIKDRQRLTSFPLWTAMSQKIDKEIRISLSMSSMFYPQRQLWSTVIWFIYPLLLFIHYLSSTESFDSLWKRFVFIILKCAYPIVSVTVWFSKWFLENQPPWLSK